MSTTANPSAVTAPVSPCASPLPLYRLHLMRAGYAFMGIGLAVTKWQVIIHHDASWTLQQSVIDCLLTAMSLLALLGLRYPIKLLPLMVFESTWKLLWLGVVALPAALAGDMSAAMDDVVFACALVVVILAVTPWRFAWRQYATAQGDPWR